MRRLALHDAEGVFLGIAEETVTEDAHTALKMHRRGWRSGYLDIPQAAGLATESLSAHVGQRIRWARGMTQIFRTCSPRPVVTSTSSAATMAAVACARGWAAADHRRLASGEGAETFDQVFVSCRPIRPWSRLSSPAARRAGPPAT